MLSKIKSGAWEVYPPNQFTLANRFHCTFDLKIVGIVRKMEWIHLGAVCFLLASNSCGPSLFTKNWPEVDLCMCKNWLFTRPYNLAYRSSEQLRIEGNVGWVGFSKSLTVKRKKWMNTGGLAPEPNGWINKSARPLYNLYNIARTHHKKVCNVTTNKWQWGTTALTTHTRVHILGKMRILEYEEHLSPLLLLILLISP